MKKKNNLKDIKKLAFIFAHPDDEAFGPAGTIAEVSKKGEVYLICVTDGNDQTRPKPKLAKRRKKELQKSADILGVKKVYFLDYKDGELSNNLYHQVADEIKEILQKIKPDTLMTFEPRGISGHIDHVFCSMVTSYLFEKLDFTKTLLYYAITKKMTDEMGDYFIYFPDGYKEKEIDLTVDVSKNWDTKKKAILSHESQIEDPEKLIQRFEKRKKEDNFLVRKKS